MTIYFDSRTSKSTYERISVEHREQGLMQTMRNDGDQGFDEG
ncbi:MAG: hypothetical protein WAK53_01860 [Chromatiaceae bacterium]